MPNEEHERERDQTHSYSYIPSAPRENYSLLVMESTGMKKMATEEGLAPPAGCRNGSRLVFGGYGGFWRRNSRSIVLSDVWGYIRGVGVENKSGESTRGPQGRGGGTLVVASGLLWCIYGTSWASSGPKISSVKFQVNWTPFDFPFLRYSKTKKKQKLALGSR